MSSFGIIVLHNLYTVYILYLDSKKHWEIDMKTLIFSLLVGFALGMFTGCTANNNSVDRTSTGC